MTTMLTRKISEDHRKNATFENTEIEKAEHLVKFS